MRIPAIIPARGGSKGIPRKNLVAFAGKPLLGWSIEHALISRLVDETYVTSDSDEILQVAVEYGAKPIRRPTEISGDRATSESALEHALNSIGGGIDYVVFLQATSPLRKPQDIDNAIVQMQRDGADSLFSGSHLVDFNLWQEKEGILTSLNYDYKNRRPRQEKRRKTWVENGSIYIFKPAILHDLHNRLGGRISIYEMEPWQAFEIDTMDEVELVEWLFKKHLIDE